MKILVDELPSDKFMHDCCFKVRGASPLCSFNHCDCPRHEKPEVRECEFLMAFEDYAAREEEIERHRYRRIDE